MAIFSQRYDGPDDQGVRDDPNRTRVAAGTTGPYSPAGADPTSYKNSAVSGLRRNNPEAKNFYQQAWSLDDANKQQKRLDGLNNSPNFSNPGDQKLAQKFAQDYAKGVSRGLVAQEDAVNEQTIAPFQSQQPGQNVGSNAPWKAGNKMDYAGTGSIQIT